MCEDRPAKGDKTQTGGGVFLCERVGRGGAQLLIHTALRAPSSLSSPLYPPRSLIVKRVTTFSQSGRGTISSVVISDSQISLPLSLSDMSQGMHLKTLPGAGEPATVAKATNVASCAAPFSQSARPSTASRNRFF